MMEIAFAPDLFEPPNGQKTKILFGIGRAESSLRALIKNQKYTRQQTVQSM